MAVRRDIMLLIGLVFLGVGLICGCARRPIWDTTQGVPTYVSPPGPLVTNQEARDSRVVLNPTEQVVPVGSEVALIASVCVSGQPAANQPVNWSLEGVGEFRGGGGVGTSAGINPAVWPQTISPNQGQSQTVPQAAVVTRGTPEQTDDFQIQRGQTWMSLSSQAEGVSVVSAYATSLAGTYGAQGVARVHWIDAQWAFPQSTNVPLGSQHPLTTQVTRATTGEPIGGYVVRYEVTGGVSAGFAPDGATMREVITNPQGEATVDLLQTQPASGTTNIEIQVIRDVPQPAVEGEATPPSERVVLGRSSVSVAWTSDVSINLAGPQRVNAGGEADYSIDVANPGEQAIQGSTVSVNIPAGWEIVGTDPIANQTGDRFTFDLGTLNPGDTQSMVVRFQVGSGQAAELCADFDSSSGARVRDCIRVTSASAALVVSMRRTDPTATIRVGDQVTWDITVRNNGTAATPEGLVVTDAYDAGLQHRLPENPIARDLDVIPAGQFISFPVTFTAAAVGQACQHVTVTNEETGQLFGEARDCVRIAAAAQPVQGELAVRMTGPLTATVGDQPIFQIEVTNTGQTTLRNVRVVDTFETGLRPVNASEGHQYDEPGGEYRLVWIVDEIAPGEFARFDVQCACDRAAQRICGRVSVEAEDGARDNDELCLDVASGVAPLSVTISQFNNPVNLGADAMYEVRITNDSDVPQTQIQVDFVLAAGMTLNRVGTRGPVAGIRDVQLDGNVVRFNPLAEIRPGESATYRVLAQVGQLGENQVKARISGGGLREPLEFDAATTVIDGS